MKKIIWTTIKVMVYVPGLIVWGSIIKDLMTDEDDIEPIVRPVMFNR